jgi:hypothetical protein
MDGGVTVEVEVRLENVCRYLVEKTNDEGRDANPERTMEFF